MKPENKAKRDALQRLQHAPKRKGMAQLKKYLSGEKLTPREAMLAKCNECTCNWADGQACCNVPACPLYPFMPFQHKAPNPGE